MNSHEEITFIQSRNHPMLCIGGFPYYYHSEAKGITKWTCKRRKDCYAWVKTSGSGHRTEIVRGGPASSKHLHAPNLEQVKALKVIADMKDEAATRPEAPPALLLRKLTELPPEVLSQLPNRLNLRKMMVRRRLKDLPHNPVSLSELKEIPDKYRFTASGEMFLLYDSFVDEEWESEGRIIVYGTRENLRHLSKSKMWFIDGTFSSAPSMFTQLFAILGTATQVINGVEEEFGIPFVYALLNSKDETAYTKVLRVVLTAIEQLGLTVTTNNIMTDFELGIINACRTVFPNSEVKCCFFHLKQSIYKRIGVEGLKVRYDDAEDRSIKVATQCMAAIAFVHIDNVKECFDQFVESLPDDEAFDRVVDYFETNYVAGKPARGRRKAVKPRYPPELWNVHNSVLDNVARTNNISEGWHNRFNILIGKKHPSFYAFLSELIKEQADSETMLRQISLGQQTKQPRSLEQRRVEKRLLNIVQQYKTYVEEDNVLSYLKNIAYNVNI